MQELTELLTDATRRIEAPYFLVPIDGGNPVCRERVYCYELYHQLRRRWPKSSQFILNGELDKAGHPKLRELEADRAKPDFLVHNPGHMSANHAIIEVKAKDADSGAIQSDLDLKQAYAAAS